MAQPKPAARPAGFKPLPASLARLSAARTRLVFMTQPRLGGSVIELASGGHNDAAPDAANRRWRAMLTRVDRQIDDMAVWIERTLEGEPPVGPRKWKCEGCGTWRKGRDAFCSTCGTPAPDPGD